MMEMSSKRGKKRRVLLAGLGKPLSKEVKVVFPLPLQSFIW